MTLYRYSEAFGLQTKIAENIKNGWYESEELALINFFKSQKKYLHKKLSGYHEIIKNIDDQIEKLHCDFKELIVKYPEELI